MSREQVGRFLEHAAPPDLCSPTRWDLPWRSAWRPGGPTSAGAFPAPPPPPPLTPAQVLAVLRAISLCSRLSPRPLQGTCSERTDARVPQLHLLLSSYEGVLFCSTVLSRGAVDTSGLATLSCGRLCCVLSHIQQQHPDLYLPDVSSIAPT